MKKLLLIGALVIAACARKEEPVRPAATPAPEINQGLQTPESVLYDAEQDVYFVSNVNGDPQAKDGNGFIVKVNPDTLKVERFVNTGLDGPKGMAITGDTLWVADITNLRKFDRKTGQPKGEIQIPDSSFLNDVATDGTSIFVSDSDAKTAAIWKISGNLLQKIASGPDLNRPNGLEIVGGKLWVVSYGSNELYQLDDGKKTNVAKLPAGSLDGLVHLADGTFLVSSWDSSTVYRGRASGPFDAVITGVKSPADIGYDTKRRRVMVPHFTESRVTIHPLQ